MANFGVRIGPDGTQDETNTMPDGTQTFTYSDGRVYASAADGTQTMSALGGEPRWGMEAPVVSSEAVTTPAGVYCQEISRVRRSTASATTRPDCS